MSISDSTLPPPSLVVRRAPAALRVRSGALVWLALLAVFAWRLGWDGTHQIVSDEAVYWTWSRHPAAGYLDHPPMVAYLIGLSTKLLGSTPLGVRFFAAAFACGSVGILISLATRLLRDARQVAWCGWLLMLSPLVAVLGTIITPDTPAIFFCCCALACAIAAVDRPEEDGADVVSPGPRWRVPLLWLAFGAFVGLALLTKYTAVLLPASVAVALLTGRRGRVHLRRPWVYLAALVALLIFSPVLYWNWRHGWVSFRFQLNHGLGEHADDDAEPVRGTGRLLTALAQLAEYAGGQAAVWNPVLMVLGLLAIAGLLRRYATLPVSRQVLLWCSAVPLLFFGAASLKSKGEMNWPAFAYFPLSLLTVEYAFASGSSLPQAIWRRKWLGTGLWVAGIGCLVVSMPLLLVGVGVRLSKFDELSGWPEFARQLEEKRAGLPVVCNMQRDAGQVAFHLPGQPDVRAVSIGSRPTAFDYMDDRLNPRSMPRLVFVGKHADAFCAAYGFAPVRRDFIKVRLETGRQRARQVTFLERLPKESAAASGGGNEPFTGQVSPRPSTDR